MNLAQSYLGEKVLEQSIRYVARDPMKNLPLLLEIADRVAKEAHHKENISNVRRVLQDKDGNWYRYVERLLTQTHPRVRERLAVNFFLNASLLGIPKQNEAAKRLGVSVPFTILIDPTERCNLKCKGCWAGDYQREAELDYETLDRLMDEAEELGIYLIVMSGGEPLIRKDDIMSLAQKHQNLCFHIYTNATLIDERFAEDLVRAGNITFAISLEGLEDSTDQRRGKGVFQKVIRAMDILREAGVVYGFSATYTRQNTEEIGSEEFIDLMVQKGCALGWFFTYVPVGGDVDLEYMATPDQRAWMYQRIHEFRQTKPIFLVDFWNDGEASQGCIAGGRRYFHINASGDVEPCAFVHYATCNIRDVTLKEALVSPLMKAYQKRQPFSTNMLRPCPLIDNPDALAEIVKEAGAYSTQKDVRQDPDTFAHQLSGYACGWQRFADHIWNDKKPECEACR
jgi:MoaA/NifB/PqqE/SkfB family radical SAM enzyme